MFVVKRERDFMSEKPGKSKNAAISPLRILYIDDYAFDRELVRHALEEDLNGFQLTEAVAREELEVKLAEGSCDLVLSDLNILGFEGLEVIDTIQTKAPDVPVVIVTGTGTEGIAVEAIKRGAADYIIKTPDHIRRLPHTIKTVMEKKRLQDEHKQAVEELARERDLLRTLIDAVPDYIFVKDREGRFIASNLAHAAAAGVAEPEELYGKNTLDVFPENMAVQFHEDDEKVMQTGVSLINEERRTVDADGNEREVLTTKVPLRNQQGEITALVGLSRDVTERKKMETELSNRVYELVTLRQMEANLAARLSIDYVVEIAMDSAMHLADADAGYIALLESNGLQLAQVAGCPEEKVKLHLKQKEGIAWRVMRERKPELIADVHSDPDYVAIDTRVSAMMAIPLISRKWPIGLLVLTTQKAENFTVDAFEFLLLLTGRIAAALDNANLYHQTEQQLVELQSLYEQVRKLEQMKTEMIRIASHDLGSPLASILGYVQVLRLDAEEHWTPEQLNHLNYIEQAARQMRQISTNILSLERIEEMARADSQVLVNMKLLVKNVIKELEGRVQSKFLNIELDITPAPVLVRGVAVQLHEAVVNLIGNAIKYTSEGGQITVHLREDGGRITFKVIDNGNGVPEAEQGHLFQPFFRAKNSRSKQVEGTGLGLYLVKNIVERHRGEIIFKSTEGEGSTFGFKIPVFAETVR